MANGREPTNSNGGSTLRDVNLTLFNHRSAAIVADWCLCVEGLILNKDGGNAPCGCTQQ